MEAEVAALTLRLQQIHAQLGSRLVPPAVPAPHRTLCWSFRQRSVWIYLGRINVVQGWRKARRLGCVTAGLDACVSTRRNHVFHRNESMAGGVVGGARWFNAADTDQ